MLVLEYVELVPKMCSIVVRGDAAYSEVPIRLHRYYKRVRIDLIAAISAEIANFAKVGISSK